MLPSITGIEGASTTRNKKMKLYNAARLLGAMCLKTLLFAGDLETGWAILPPDMQLAVMLYALKDTPPDTQRAWLINTVTVSKSYSDIIKKFHTTYTQKYN